MRSDSLTTTINIRDHELSDQRAHEASAWIEALQHPNAEVRAAFAAWLKKSPLNVAELLVMLSVEEAIGGTPIDWAHDG
jgi:ferric-dicitrate binding protein FerR (iron transport regulator)